MIDCKKTNSLFQHVFQIDNVFNNFIHIPDPISSRASEKDNAVYQPIITFSFANNFNKGEKQVSDISINDRTEVSFT